RSVSSSRRVTPGRATRATGATGSAGTIEPLSPRRDADSDLDGALLKGRVPAELLPSVFELDLPLITACTSWRSHAPFRRVEAPSCAIVPRGHGSARGAAALEERDDRGRREGLRLRAGLGDRSDRRHRRRQLWADRGAFGGGGDRCADGPVDDAAARGGRPQ